MLKKLIFCKDGSAVIEKVVICAVAILLIFSLFQLLKSQKALENVMLWFQNTFVKGVSGI